MKLLLDTHVLIGWTADLKRLSSRARAELSDSNNQIFVSAVSAWEIALKTQLGKLTFDQAFLASFDSSVSALSFNSLDISSRQMIVGAQIPGTHKDPFDRMLAGQALVEQMAVVTADPAFKHLGVQVVW